MEVPLSFIDAALGTTIDVPSVYGDLSVDVPAGTQPEKILKIKGKGVKDLRGNAPGDHFIHLRLQTPQSLTKKQKELLESFRSEAEDKDNPFKKFKRFFKN
jgi:molecular chaperone DnaJ